MGVKEDSSESESEWETDEEERSQVVGFIEPLTFNLKSSLKFQLLVHNN